MSKRAIYKYQVEGTRTTIQVPKGAQFLSLAHQPAPAGLVVYALVDPEAAPVARQVVVVGTGRVMEAAELEGLEFIATLGALGFHLFVEREMAFEGINADGSIAYAAKKGKAK